MNPSLKNIPISQDDRALKTLARSISLSHARFSLIFVRCPLTFPTAEMLNQLQVQYGVIPEVLELPSGAEQLYPHVYKLCKGRLPSNLFITGLHHLNALDELLISTNQMRDEFRRSFPFPLVFWTNDEIIRKLIKLAPDFYSWASAPISLEG